MQKYMKTTVIAMVAAMGTSFAAAGSAEPAANTAERTQSGHGLHARQAGKIPSSDGWRHVGGEAVWILDVDETGSQVSRSQVLKELAEFQNDPEAQSVHQRLYHSGS